MSKVPDFPDDFTKKVNEEWLGRLQENAAMIADSAAFIGMLNGKFDDPLQAMQFSIALFMDKPLHLIVAKGMKVPDKIKGVAESIQYVDYNDMNAMKAAVEKINESMRDE